METRILEEYIAYDSQVYKQLDGWFISDICVGSWAGSVSRHRRGFHWVKSGLLFVRDLYRMMKNIMLY